ncbi:MAG TPA: LacI family DNA-binding transcriptional regulator [Alphaproteobacteria bacterium]|nr:LacI family DNA-binding transcriptional regulator [Alphaproteobacteria bacterium]
MPDGEHRPKRKRDPRRPSNRVRVVALVAGVSVATVSRALNRTGRLSAETLQRVRKAAENLGYVPHGAARALASSHVQNLTIRESTAPPPAVRGSRQSFTNLGTYTETTWPPPS